MAHKTFSDDDIVALTQRVVRHASEQTEKMEQDPAVLSFVTECAKPVLDAAGLPSKIDDYGNLICEAGPDTEMPILLLAYAMTHPGNRMTDPFKGEKVETPSGPAVRGRGVSEQKSALSASLAAFVDIATSGKLKKRVAWALLTAGETGRHDAIAVAMKNLSRQPKLAILGVGTNTRIALGNRGRLDVMVHIQGKASHSSTPWAGVDVTKGIREILGRADAITAKLPSHEKLGPATLTCTSIKTGPYATHTVQSDGWMVFDRRLMPGEDPEAVLKGLRESFKLDAPLACSVERGPFMYGSEVDPKGPLVSAIEEALTHGGLAKVETFYSPSSLDAGYLVVNGIEAVKWGPGSPDQFHTDEEQVPVAEVVGMFKSYRAVMSHLCG
ncbi:MAG TPA: M20/M25/M40 family metallo-hydrolase [Pseudolabrys sp.]|nr:M20/M25/M40 family metallo-hydrolase [Pseudolabrys sp.]